jgi:glucose/arabinose dehydrogenase
MASAKWRGSGFSTARKTPRPGLPAAVAVAYGYRFGGQATTRAVPGPDGALYVSDDTAGAIYRLAPAA